MEQTFIIARLKEITVPELLDAMAEAHAVEAIDIYEHLSPDLIDKTTDTLWEFIDAVKQRKKCDECDHMQKHKGALELLYGKWIFSIPV
jgi:hypothetical protein